MKGLTTFRKGVFTLLAAMTMAPVATFWAMANPTPAYAAPTVYSAALNGPSESPPVASPGVGNARVTFDPAAHTLRVQAQFSGLVAGVTVAHIHVAAAPGGVGGVASQVPTFPGFPSGVTSGTYDQTFDLTLPASWNPTFVAANGGTPGTAETALGAALGTARAY